MSKISTMYIVDTVLALNYHTFTSPVDKKQYELLTVPTQSNSEIFKLSACKP